MWGQLSTTGMMAKMMNGLTSFMILFAIILSAVVIYTLMLTDVDEQTYQFAMMRALGFKQGHVIVFVVL